MNKIMNAGELENSPYNHAERVLASCINENPYLCKKILEALNTQENNLDISVLIVCFMTEAETTILARQEAEAIFAESLASDPEEAILVEQEEAINGTKS